MSKALRHGRVRIGETGARINTREEFAINYKSGQAKSIQGFVHNQFSLIDEEHGRFLKEAIKAETGKTVSIEKAMARQLSQEQWNAIDAYYQRMRHEGLSAKASRLEVGSYFFGS